LPSGECKSELRGHDNVIECIAWAPESAGVHISEPVSNGGTEVIIYLFFLKIYFNKINSD
jgi:platelet-activating factor acetylhydrolase IB subunit alpha